MVQMLIEGEQAPDFSLAGDDGDTLNLQDFQGKKVVLFFYPRDDTSGCTREATEFSGLLDEFTATDAVVIGISADSVDSHAKFKAKHGLKVRLAADPEIQTLPSYNVWVERSMYGHKYMGIQRTTFLLDREGRISRIWRKVKVAGHAERVLGAARELP